MELIRGEIRRNASHWHPPWGNTGTDTNNNTLEKRRGKLMWTTSFSASSTQRGRTRTFKRVLLFEKKSLKIILPRLDVLSFMLDGAHGDRCIQNQCDSFITKHQPTPPFYRADLGQHGRAREGRKIIWQRTFFLSAFLQPNTFQL